MSAVDRPEAMPESIDTEAIRAVSESGNVRVNRQMVTRLADEIDSLRAENERQADLIVEFRKRDETQDRIRERLTAERDAAEAKLAAARETLTDLAEHGLRADLTPTVMFGDESHVYRQLTDYLRRLDSGLRQRARAALEADVVTDDEPTCTYGGHR